MEYNAHDIRMLTTGSWSTVYSHSQGKMTKIESSMLRKEVKRKRKKV